MKTEELLRAIREGQAHVEWEDVVCQHNGHTLRVSVFRDAMKFDGIPPMNWHRQPRNPRKGEQTTYDGVRLPVTAVEMQMVADLCYCMLLTPKIVDMLWTAAGESGTQFESVVNVHGQIVAMADIHAVHQKVEEALAKAGGDKGGIIDSVGKYWVVCKALSHGKFGVHQAVNYGWPTRTKGNGLGVTKTVNVWQTIGAAHDDSHIDPSQTIRLMYRLAKLQRAGSSEWEDIDLCELAEDPELAALISHEGPLPFTRMPSVPEPKSVLNSDGSYSMPEMVIFGDPPIDN